MNGSPSTGKRAAVQPVFLKGDCPLLRNKKHLLPLLVFALLLSLSIPTVTLHAGAAAKAGILSAEYDTASDSIRVSFSTRADAAHAFCAVYDAAGQMLGVRELPDQAGTVQNVTISSVSEKPARAKVFQLDRDYRPVDAVSGATVTERANGEDPDLPDPDAGGKVLIAVRNVVHKNSRAAIQKAPCSRTC